MHQIQEMDIWNSVNKYIARKRVNQLSKVAETSELKRLEVTLKYSEVLSQGILVIFLFTHHSTLSPVTHPKNKK